MTLRFSKTLQNFISFCKWHDKLKQFECMLFCKQLYHWEKGSLTNLFNKPIQYLDISNTWCWCGMNQFCQFGILLTRNTFLYPIDSHITTDHSQVLANGMEAYIEEVQSNECRTWYPAKISIGISSKIRSHVCNATQDWS